MDIHKVFAKSLEGNVKTLYKINKHNFDRLSELCIQVFRHLWNRNLEDIENCVQLSPVHSSNKIPFGGNCANKKHDYSTVQVRAGGRARGT